MAELILEYLKVILTAPVIFGVIAATFLIMFSDEIKALIQRVAKIKLPGGAEVSTPQSSRLPEDEEEQPQPELPQAEINALNPLGLTPEQNQAVEQILRSHISNAYLWEYRYLNHFLVRHTQVVLDWLSGFEQPITYAHYDSFWLPLIASAEERNAIIRALETHHLVTMTPPTNMIQITEKGKEYREWRGDLPALSSSSEAENP
ncbi:MAG: hypothetical protein ABW078_14815 [Sedimenticola sp.]